MKHSCLALLLILLSSRLLFADQQIDMLRVLCLPDPGLAHLSFEVESYPDFISYISLGQGSSDDNKFSKQAEDERINNLRKYGLIYPRNFNYTCDLPNGRYEITGDLPNGTVTLKKGGRVILHNIAMTNQCNSPKCALHPYISKVTLEEKIRGWRESVIYITVSGVNKSQTLLLKNKVDRKSDKDYYRCLGKHGITFEDFIKAASLPIVKECDALRKYIKPLPVTQETINCVMGITPKNANDASPLKKQCILYGEPTAEDE